MEHKFHDHETTILTDEENREFTGVTLDEEGHTYEDRRNTIFADGPNPYNEEINNQFKIYSFSNLSLIQKILLGIVAIAIIILLVSFGGLFLIGAVTIAVIGWIVAILRRLF